MTPPDIPALLARANRKNRYTLAQAWDLIDLLAAALENESKANDMLGEERDGWQRATAGWKERAERAEAERDAALQRAESAEDGLEVQNERFGEERVRADQLEAERDAARADKLAFSVLITRAERERDAARAERDEALDANRFLLKAASEMEEQRDAALALLKEVYRWWQTDSPLTADDIQSKVESFLHRIDAMLAKGDKA